MLKGNKYRIYPTAEQEVLLAKHFGCVRALYNLALETKSYAYNAHRVSLSYFTLKKEIVGLKKDLPWLKEVNSQSLQASLQNLDTAYQNFFKHGAGFPDFKSKFDDQSFVVPQNFFIEEGKLNMPKFREGIEIVLHRPMKGVMKSVTISKTRTGKYFASILTDSGNVAAVRQPLKPETAVGIDLGLKTFVVGTGGVSFANPKYLAKSQTHLKWLQRKFSRKKKGSNRREKFRVRLAKAHEKVANQRKDFLHKVSDSITKNFDTVCMEDLNVKGMMKNHKLANSISDVGWGMFKTFVKYKCEWRGKNFIELPTFEPSSKECSVCEHLNHDLKLSDREWDCANCGTHHDRDENAAKVIRKKCLRRAERSLQDAEVSPLAKRKRFGKRAVEASKVQNDVLRFAS